MMRKAGQSLVPRSGCVGLAFLIIGGFVSPPTAIGQQGSYIEERRIEAKSDEALHWLDADHVVISRGSSTALLELSTPRVLWEESVRGLMSADPEGRFLVFTENRGSKVLDVKTGQEINSFPPSSKYNNHVTAVDITADGNLLAIVIRSDWRIDFHQLPGGAPRGAIRTDFRVNAADFSPDGRAMAVSSSGAGDLGGIFLYGTDGQLIKKLVDRVVDEPWHIGQLKFSANGRLLAGLRSGDSLRNSRLLIWDAGSGGLVREITAPVTGPLAWSATGNLVAAGGSWPLRPDNQYGAVGVWDAARGEQVATLTHLEIGNRVGLPFIFSKDGRRIAIASANIPGQKLIVWKWQAGASPTAGIVDGDVAAPGPAGVPASANTASFIASRVPEAQQLYEKVLSGFSRVSKPGFRSPIVEPTVEEFRRAAPDLARLVREYADTGYGGKAAAQIETFARRHAGQTIGVQASRVAAEYADKKTRYRHVVPIYEKVLTDFPGSLDAKAARDFLARVGGETQSETGQRALAAVQRYDAAVAGSPAKPGPASDDPAALLETAKRAQKSGKGPPKAKNGRAARQLIDLIERHPESPAAREAIVLLEQILARFPKLRIAGPARKCISNWRARSPQQ